MAENTSIVKPDNDPTTALRRFLDVRTKNLAKFATSRVKPETLIRLATFEFARNEWLRRCTPESIYNALILSAQMGLEPSGIRGEAYLVPFKGQCQLIPGWRGLVKLALRSKAVTALYSHVVYERDYFKVILGSSVRIDHEPSIESDRGGIIAAYAVAKMANGEVDVEVMTRDELEHIKQVAASSRGGKAGPAYEEWEDQMFRKAPIRRLAKRLPMADDFFLAAKADELAEAGTPEKMSDFIDAEFSESGGEQPAGKQDSLAGAVADKAKQLRENNA